MNGVPWPGVAALCALTAGITVFLMWIFNPPEVQSAASAAPVTVTAPAQTFLVTATPTQTPATTTPTSTTPAAVPQKWAVSTPAGMRCSFDDTVIVCTGEFESGAGSYSWSAGAQMATPETRSVTATGQVLKYGARNTAGPWELIMEESGITFRHKGSGTEATFSKEGVHVTAFE